MKERIYLLLTLTVLLFCTTALSAEEIYFASGAGYKRMMNEITSLYDQKDDSIHAIYGNMKQIITQAEQSDKIRILIGDNNFLKKSGLKFTKWQELGKGTLVLAYRKGLSLTDPSDILNMEIERIMLPDPKNAIYGNAAVEYMKTNNYYSKVEDRFLIVKTIPQVSAYLVSGETDAGFINYSDYTAIKDSIGGFFILDKNDYSKIIISAAVLNKDSEGVNRFLGFLKSEKAVEILNKYGVKQ